jgi:hypothetical protein
MVIGQDILVSAINDNTRAETVFNILSFAGFKKIPEKSVKEIITFPRGKGVNILFHQLTGANIDYSRAYLPDGLYYSILSGKGLISPA